MSWPQKPRKKTLIPHYTKWQKTTAPRSPRVKTLTLTSSRFLPQPIWWPTNPKGKNSFLFVWGRSPWPFQILNYLLSPPTTAFLSFRMRPGTFTLWTLINIRRGQSGETSYRVPWNGLCPAHSHGYNKGIAHIVPSHLVVPVGIGSAELIPVPNPTGMDFLWDISSW